MIKVSSYGDSSSSNYGVNCLRVTVGSLTFYFSYQTVVAFRSPATGLVVIRNYWSTTTGKHLNAIDNGNKSERLEQGEFDTKLAEVMARYGLEEMPAVSI